MSKSRKIPILVLSSTFPRFEGDPNPTFVFSLSKELAQIYEVHVLAPHCEGSLQQELMEGIHVHRYRYAPTTLEQLAYRGGMLAALKKNILNYLLVPPFFIAQIVSIIALNRRFGFRLVHAHWLIPQALCAIAARYISGHKYKILATSHGADLFSLKGPLLTKIKQHILNTVDGVTVVSNVMYEVCRDLGMNPDKLSVASMGVDLTHQFTVGEAGGNVRTGLIFVGRLVEKKGVCYLLEACAKLRSRHPGLRLKIIGDGPEKGSLVDLAAELGIIDLVEFSGALPNHEIPKHLRQAMISVVPSIVATDGDQEGLGLVAVEAIGCGCVVVASDLPAIRDVIREGETGLLAEAMNSDSLASKIDLALTSEGLRAKLLESGRRNVESRFDWQQVGEIYSDKIAKLINGKLQ